MTRSEKEYIYIDPRVNPRKEVPLSLHLHLILWKLGEIEREEKKETEEEKWEMGLWWGMVGKRSHLKRLMNHGKETSRSLHAQRKLSKERNKRTGNPASGRFEIEKVRPCFLIKMNFSPRFHIFRSGSLTLCFVPNIFSPFIKKKKKPTLSDRLKFYLREFHHHRGTDPLPHLLTSFRWSFLLPTPGNTVVSVLPSIDFCRLTRRVSDKQHFYRTWPPFHPSRTPRFECL